MSRDKEWQVGDRVQRVEHKDDGDIFHGGVVSSLVEEEYESLHYFSRERKVEKRLSYLNVKWDDGKEEQLAPYQTSREDSPLEREFRAKAPAVIKLIDEKLAVAYTAIEEAEAIAEEHGIPFSSGVSPLSQCYMATSFPNKWDGVSKKVVESVADVYSEYDDYYGWQHSAVC